MSDEFKNADLTARPPEPVSTTEEEQKEEKQSEEKKEKSLGEVLAEFENAPDDAQVEKWKQEYGEALCSMFSETELFIFRPVKRDEWVNLQMHIANAQQKGEQISSFDIEEKIVESCCLWYSPAGQKSLLSKAGSMTTLHEQILQSSNFVNPAYAGQFVVKL